ncbi:hypothetical protein V8G54_017716 [Vigna mungo]|uniref:HSF-type DNA-binding domain-containing protein n=1 Tax=Vigna mungo TaxID=3915 RepID=A0AAQ3S2A9_VIGMU
MSQRSVPAPFLTKTYELVDDPETNEVISWSDTGNTFVVWKHAEFSKDLLPKCFKHNNFSSFVRQLNTYGFRKIVPDKWEFANEHFKRGHKELLCDIKRRKTVPQLPALPPEAGKSSGGGNSPLNSGGGDDAGSTSTSSSSSGSKNTGLVETNTTASHELSSENQKLKKDNETLSCELARARKQCDELVAYLKNRLMVGPDQIDRIMRQGSCGSEKAVGEEGGGECLKLFGVWLKEDTLADKRNNNHKRAREDQMGFGGPRLKESKPVVDFEPINLIMTSNKVCN